MNLRQNSAASRRAPVPPTHCTEQTCKHTLINIIISDIRGLYDVTEMCEKALLTSLYKIGNLVERTISVLILYTYFCLFYISRILETTYELFTSYNRANDEAKD